VRFQTKPELALQMLERIFQAAVPIEWVVADTVYGGNLDLRTWLETHQYPYVLAVACDSACRLPDPHWSQTRRSCLGRSVGAERTRLAPPLDE
jgi:SRSO17 transposase